MMEKEKMMLENTVPETEEEPAKKRFEADADMTEVYLTPQCVDCVHNGGRLQCAKYQEKPVSYMSNTADCPAREV